MAEPTSTPVWAWVPGATEPVLAAHLDTHGAPTRWRYTDDYLDRPQAVACDPTTLRLHKAANRRGLPVTGDHGLPGVVLDAAPQGWGADRLHHAAGHELSTLELLEAGPADTIGAIEVCHDIDAKLGWRPKPFTELADVLRLLQGHEPPSRAVRRLLDDASTSAGGERPKVTVSHQGKLYLAKMQARGDVPFLPHKEFVAMRLAQACGLVVPDVQLQRVGEHVVYLIERFDREGDPHQPARKLCASASTVLRLGKASVQGDPRRSYLALADDLRRWGHGSDRLDGDLKELWRRMAYNALVGNSDDHHKNHAVLFDQGHWGLSPAFDITPARQFKRTLSMATGADGRALVSASRLVACAPHFGMAPEEAAQWLMDSANRLMHGFEPMLLQQDVPQVEVDDTRQALSLSEELAQGRAQDELDQAVEAARRPQGRSRRPQRT